MLWYTYTALQPATKAWYGFNVYAVLVVIVF